MNPKHIFPALSILALLTALLACSLPNAPVTATPTAADLPEASATSPTADEPTATSAPDGSNVAFSGVSFTLPTALGVIGTAETVPAISIENSPGWDAGPAYTKFTLKNYPLQGTLIQPEIRVYPAKEYETISNGAAESLKRLRALTSGAGMGVDNNTLPFVPYFNATQTFEAQAMPINFQSGTGYRTITQYDQAFIPVNNHEMIYHFQGLTSDGAYYIIATLPLNSPILAADGNPASAIPAGGVPFNQNDPMAYFDTVAQTLNDAAPESFSPSLTTLDALIGSIKVTTP